MHSRLAAEKIAKLKKPTSGRDREDHQRRICLIPDLIPLVISQLVIMPSAYHFMYCLSDGRVLHVKIRFMPHLHLREAKARFLRSRKFLRWHSRSAEYRTVGGRRVRAYKDVRARFADFDEKHFSPAELAKAWGVSVELIRSLFRTEPGVLKLGSNGTRHRRGYITLRIPENVAQRVHRRLSA